MPTKMLGFYEKIAGLLKIIGGVVNFSIGYDAFERGVCSQGHDNLSRIYAAERYMKEGVNITLTVVCDLTSSLEDNFLRGSSVMAALEARSRGLSVRFIPLRISSNPVAVDILGFGRKELLGFKGQKNLYGSLIRRYQLRKNNEIEPRILHENFKRLIFDEGLGLCGRVGLDEFCDKCNLEGDKRIVFPTSQLEIVKRTTRRTKKAEPNLFDNSV